MSTLRYNRTYLLPIVSSMLFFAGCSLHKEMPTEVTVAHPYNSQYGVVEDPHTDAIIAQEIQSINQPTEVIKQLDDPSYTTELKEDPDAFVEEEWVQPEPVIMYKYDDDPKFYREDELPENKFKMGNVIIKVPEGANKETILQGIEYASTPQSGY